MITPPDPTVEPSDEPQRARDRRGFTMVEVIFAIVILAIGVLGLAGTTAFIVRQITLSDLMTERAMALQSTIERVQATPFASLAAGSDSIGVFYVRWTVASESGQSKLVTIVTSGPGLSSSAGYPVLQGSVEDTFVYRVIND